MKQVFDRMKVSILVPVYGVERYMEACATSLFRQTYENLEYVFVDDCTPDGSMAVLQQVMDRYPDRAGQVKIVRHEKNRGLGASRKTALAASTGDFVLNVDSDDYLTETAVERLVQRQEETGADIVTGAPAFLTPDGKLSPQQVRVLDRKRMLRLMLVQNTVLPHIWARLISRRVYTDHGIDAVEGINMAEDYGLTPRLVCAARSVAFVGEVVYVYRKNSAASTFAEFTKPEHVKSFLMANETVRQYIQAHDEGGEYEFALETGMLNTYHIALGAGWTAAQVAEVCHYRPRLRLFRLYHRLFVHQSTLGLLRFIYLATKGLYRERLYRQR